MRILQSKAEQEAVCGKRRSNVSMPIEPCRSVSRPELELLETVKLAFDARF
jgi:hypothetical protein